MARAVYGADRWEELSSELRTLRQRDLYRDLPDSGGKLIDFSSNDYLGLANHPQVCASAHQAIRRYGTGSGASRLISGNLRIHERLEQKLAGFKGERSALIFSSGYMANLGAITTLVNEKDLVFLDRLNHASLVDAARLSHAKLWPYPHRDVDRLRELLRRSGGFRRRLVITDAYFSMDGDVAPLDKMLELCKETNSWLMIDEAHSTGVFGAHGRGLTEHFGIEGKVPVVMGTLSKALGSVGGFVAGDPVLTESLVNGARQFIYTTAPAPSASAAAIASLDWIESNPSAIANFWELIAFFRSSLKELGFDLMDSQGPIIPILLGDAAKTLKYRDFLKKEGFRVGAIRPPSVPKGTDRLRISLKATHKKSDIKRLAASLGKVARRLQ